MGSAVVGWGGVENLITGTGSVYVELFGARSFEKILEVVGFLLAPAARALCPRWRRGFVSWPDGPRPRTPLHTPKLSYSTSAKPLHGFG
jgi:hypothetical protein